MSCRPQLLEDGEITPHGSDKISNYFRIGKKWFLRIWNTPKPHTSDTPPKIPLKLQTYGQENFIVFPKAHPFVAGNTNFGYFSELVVGVHPQNPKQMSQKPWAHHFLTSAIALLGTLHALRFEKQPIHFSNMDPTDLFERHQSQLKKYFPRRILLRSMDIRATLESTQGIFNANTLATLHTDFWDQNLFCHHQSGRLVGVIDYGEWPLGDQSWDLALLFKGMPKTLRRIGEELYCEQRAFTRLEQKALLRRRITAWQEFEVIYNFLRTISYHPEESAFAYEAVVNRLC
ncbi:MAG: phosphotransferase [Myxococcota bacterium]|nr:phosphotransferase [Myxococcota bacterium]